MKTFSSRSIPVMICVALLVFSSTTWADASSTARIKMLVAAANDPDSNVRQAAIRALGAMRDPAVVPTLIKLMQDPTEAIRLQSAGALVEIGDPRSLDTFITATRDPSHSVRINSINGLKKLKDARSIPALLAAMYDPNSNVALAATNAVLTFGDLAVNGLAKAFDGPAGVRARATDVLAKIGTPKAMAKLQVASEHKDWFVRYDAVRALNQASKPSRAILLKCVRDRHAGVRNLATTLLGQNFRNDRQARTALMGLLKDPDPRTKYLAAEALKNVRDPRLPRLFVPLLSDPNEYLRRFAAENISSSNDTKALTALAKCTGDQDQHVRSLAVRAIAMRRSDQTVNQLTEIALSDDTTIASLAASYLNAQPADRGTAALGIVARKARPDIRRNALRMLAARCTPEAVKHVQAAWPEMSVNIRRDVIRAIPHNRAEAAVDLLGKAVQESDTSTRTRAAQSIRERLTNNRQILPHLIAAAGNSDKAVAHTALSLLAAHTDKRAVPILLAAAEKGALTEQPWERFHLQTVAGRLARDAGPRAFRPLSEALSTTTDPYLRRSYLLGIGISKSPKALAFLTEEIRNRDDVTRSAAAAALGFLEDPKAIDVLKRAAAPNDKPAAYAVTAWARLDSTGAFDAFCKMLQARFASSTTRTRFVATFTASKTKDVTTALLALAAGTDRSSILYANQWLTVVGDKRTRPALEKLAADKASNSRTVNEARAALERMHRYRQLLEMPYLPVR